MSKRQKKWPLLGHTTRRHSRLNMNMGSCRGAVASMLSCNKLGYCHVTLPAKA